MAEVLRSHWLGYGPAAKRFEAELAALFGVKHVFAVNTGTAALTLALGSLEMPPGAEVIVPAMTFVSTIQAIVLTGATPVFAEIEPETLCLDPADLPRRLTPRTRAILPVHYGGQPCAMEEIHAFAREHGLHVVEDAAHAIGSTWRGRPVGSLSALSCFSFDPIKNITCGGGGAVVTDDDELAGRIAPRRNVGIKVDSWTRHSGSEPWRYDIVEPGQRCLMSDLNAAIGLSQLPKLEGFRRRKLEICARYNEAFAGMDGVDPIRVREPGTFPFTWVLRVPSAWRNALVMGLNGRGIGATVQFTPNHLQPAFAAYAKPLPVTERLYGEIVNLPLYVDMTDADVEEVIAAVKEVSAEVAAARPGTRELEAIP